MSSRIRAVLLDMGGVLVPEVSEFERAAQQPDVIDSLRRLGAERPAELLCDCADRVRSAYRALNEACSQPDLDETLSDVPAPLRARVLRAFAEVTDRRPYADLGPIVANLARRYRLAVVSNNIIPGDHHLRSLRRAGLMQHIRWAVWSANFGRRKPDPAMMLWALGKLEVPAHQAVFVGDKIRTDVAGAQRAGMRSVHLRRFGAERAPARGQPVPDFVIRSLAELAPLLRPLG